MISPIQQSNQVPSRTRAFAYLLEPEQVFFMGERLARAEAATGGVYYPDLYGVVEFWYGDHPLEQIKQETTQQELTHLAEGIALRQQTSRELSFASGHVLDSQGQPLVEAFQGGLDLVRKQRATSQNPAYEKLEQRREADIVLAEQADKFMVTAGIGDTFWVASPFAEEVDTDTVDKVFGHWPKYRRSFIWLGRKLSDSALELTDITIDRSQVSTYAKLLDECGVQLPPGTESHDIPFYFVQGPTLQTKEERNTFIRKLRSHYYELQGDRETGKKDEQEAIAFLNENARPLLSVSVAVQEAVAISLREGRTEPLVLQSAAKALHDLRLTDHRRQFLEAIVSGQALQERNYEAFAMLVRAQRYGIWAAMSSLIATGESLPPILVRQFEGNYNHLGQVLGYLHQEFNLAVIRGESMPGCAGGVRFDLLGLDPTQAAEAIFGGDESWHGGKIHRNEKCQSCKVTKSEVGACHICHDCVRNPARMEAAWNAPSTKLVESVGAALLKIMSEFVASLKGKPMSQSSSLKP